MLTLYVLSGPDVGKSYELRDGSVLGRAPSADPPLAVPVRDGSVSRSHARIEVRGERWYVVDLDSRNGVRFDGMRVAEGELTDGTEFALGDLALRVRGEAAASPAPKPRVEIQAPSPATPAREPEPEEEPELELDDEIELEEEIELEGFDEESSPPIAEPAPTPRPAPAPAPKQRPPSGVPQGLRQAAARPDLAQTRASRRPDEGEPTQKKNVLQYHKVENRSGVFATDMAQQSPLVRALMILLAIAAFIGIFYGAFQASQLMKKRTTGGTSEYVESDED